MLLQVCDAQGTSAFSLLAIAAAALPAASAASVRSIFRSWIGSTGHRENILGPYAQIGIGLRIGDFEGSRGTHVWVQEFGSHNC